MIVGCSSSVVCRPSCVVRRQQLLQMTSPPKPEVGFLPNPNMTLFKNYSNGSGPLHIKVTQAKTNTLEIFLSETIMPRALIFDMKHHLVNLYQVCSSCISGAPGVKCCTFAYIGKTYKNLLV